MHPAQRLPSHISRSALQRYLLVLLTLALLWLPLAGKLHQVVHSKGNGHFAAQSANPAFETFFVHYAPDPVQNGNLDCQLFDAHCCGLALSNVIPTLPASTFAQVVVLRTEPHFAAGNLRLIPEARAGPAFI